MSSINHSTLTPQATIGFPELLLLCVAFFWGTSYALTKEAVTFVPVIIFIALRFGMTALTLVPVVWHEYRQKQLADAWIAIPSGTLLLAIFVSETYGVAHTEASRAAVLISLCVMITPLMEWAFYKTYPGHRVLLMAGVCLMGVCLLSLKEGFTLRLNQGDWAILAAAFLRACQVITTKSLFKGRTLSNLSLTMLQSSCVTGGAILIALFTEQSWSLPTTGHFWLMTAYLVGFCTLLAFFAQNYALRRSSPSKVGLLMGTEPAFGAIFAMLWLGESLSGIQLAGCGLIIGASLYASR